MKQITKLFIFNQIMLIIYIIIFSNTIEIHSGGIGTYILVKNIVGLMFPVFFAMQLLGNTIIFTGKNEGA